jgi:hypothetical protein
LLIVAFAASFEKVGIDQSVQAILWRWSVLASLVFVLRVPVFLLCIVWLAWCSGWFSFGLNWCSGYECLAFLPVQGFSFGDNQDGYSASVLGFRLSSGRFRSSRYFVGFVSGLDLESLNSVSFISA